MSAPKPWIAALLSLIETPLGLLYAGHPKQAVVYWLLVELLYVATCALVATGKLNSGLLITVFLALMVFRYAAPLMAWRVAKRAVEERRWFQRWPGLLLLFLLVETIGMGVILLNRAYVLESFRVPGRAMAATINHQDRIFVDKLFARAADLRRGDLVVFRASEDGPIFVSRIVALAGDTISLQEDTLRLNGEVIVEPYASYQPSPYKLSDLPETKVPSDHFFVLGDNRNFSSDSRTYGPVPFSQYHGRPTNIIFSRQYESIDNADSEPEHTPGPIAWERIGKNITR